MNTVSPRSSQALDLSMPPGALGCAGKAVELAKPRAMPPSLADAVWVKALSSLKTQIEEIQGQGPGGTTPGAALSEKRSSAATEAPAANSAHTAGQLSGFDFAQFADLVRELINSTFTSSSSAGAGEQPSQELDPGAAGVQAPATQVDPAVDEQRSETIAILGRHEGKFKKAVDGKGLDKMLNDEKTPPDLKRAIQNLKADPQMMEALDKAKNGKSDGKISAKDINILQSNATNKAFAEKKAEHLTHTYVPSDLKGTDAQPREITNNDAQRELFRYADNLPKHVSRESLQKIVDGTSEQGKCPPQLVAAAKFYVDNPAAWEKDMGKGANESIRRDGLANRVTKSIELTPEEDKTLKVLDENRDVFFSKGALKESKLKEISENPKLAPEVREAAKSLLDSKGSLLFNMLDNGKHGHGGNIIHAADDRSIGAGDLDRVMKDRNKTVAPTEKSSAGSATRIQTAADAQAAQDMMDGTQNQPDKKSKKGGELKDAANIFLKAYSFVQGVVSDVLGVVANMKIPGVSWIAAAGSVSAQALSGAAKVASTALEDGDVKGAAIGAGVSVATTAVGVVVPGGGRIVGEAAEHAAKNSTKWAHQAVNSSTDITNGQVTRAAGTTAAKSTVKGAAMTAFEESGAQADVTGQATNAAREQQLQHQIAV